jgi:predicted PurR-regulated permease PerM
VGYGEGGAIHESGERAGGASPPATRPGARATDTRVLLVPMGLMLLGVAYLAFQVFQPFLLDFTAAASLTLLLAPLQRRLARVLGGRRSIAAGLLVLLVFVLILLPILSYAAILGQQAVSVYDWIRPRVQPAALAELWRHRLLDDYPLLAAWLAPDEAAFTQFVSNALSRLASAFNTFIQVAVTRVTTTLFDLFLFLLMLFFLLRDGPRLRAELGRISPLSAMQEDEVLGHLEKTVKAVLIAMVVVPLAQGALAALGFRIFGVPSPLLWGVMVVLAALVPLLGSPLAWVPAVVYLFLNGATWQWIGMLAWGLIVISGIDNVIKPLILRGRADLHPLLGFLAILGGAVSFGPVGLLVGPVILSLVISGIRIYRLDVLGRLRPQTRAEPDPAAAE